MAQGKRFEIVDGPSKLDFMLSLFDVPDSQMRRRAVAFKLAVGGEYMREHIEIDQAKRSTFRGDDWSFVGRTVHGIVLPGNVNVRGSFSTHARRGWVEIDPKK